MAHIGSIEESECRPQDPVFSREDEGRRYYVVHLGLLGTLTMLHQLNPTAAMVSEFGSDLKGFHFELVDKLQQALHARILEPARSQQRVAGYPPDRQGRKGACDCEQAVDRPTKEL